jgi:hypothetical protein
VKTRKETANRVSSRNSRCLTTKRFIAPPATQPDAGAR